ncbi:MAG TPA: hypothetical protein VKE93_04105 [Candidatus Angelobacter sp.]|nr:hypothetical protein [Candidatus Angelobacter sp.]
MLDLSVSTRSVAGIDLARDTEDPLRFYVLPSAPRLSSANGSPDVQLLRLVQNGELQGGNLRLGLDLQQPQAALDQARSALEDELKRTPVVLTPVPIVDASAEVHFVGKEPTAAGGLSALLRRAYGRTAASFEAPHAANFSISLSPEGVQLVEAAMRSGAAPVGASYWLRMEGLWPAQRILARIDWGRVYDHYSMQAREGYLLYDSDIQKITEHLIESRVITIQVVRGIAEPADSKNDDGTQEALQWIQRELVERFCEPVLPLNREPAHASLGTLGEMFGVGSAFAFKQLKQIERATEEIDLQQKRVISRTITPQAHLADLLAGSDPADHIADAGLNHPFFQRMVLNVRSAQTLPSLHLKEAIVQVDYGSAQQALRLTPDSPQSAFSAWADSAPDRTWKAHAEVTFADDSPVDPGQHYTVEAGSGQSRELTLDLKQMLGLARCVVRPPVDDRVALGDLQVKHSRGAEKVGETQLSLPPKGPEQVVWFRDCRPGDQLQAALRYLLADGRIISVPQFPIDTEIVQLPQAFPGVLTVQMISDDDWNGLDRVTVAIQKNSTAPAGTLVFDKPGKVVTVNLDMPDPVDRSFRYRVTRTLATGVEENDDWVEADVAVVVVGKIAANRLVVDVVPLGPELPQAGIRLLQVELSYVDSENQVREQATMEIAAKAERQRWEIAIKNPQRRSYEYRTTLFPLAGGPPVVGHWTTASDRILAVPITPTS